MPLKIRIIYTCSKNATRKNIDFRKNTAECVLIYDTNRIQIDHRYPKTPTILLKLLVPFYSFKVWWKEMELLLYFSCDWKPIKLEEDTKISVKVQVLKSYKVENISEITNIKKLRGRKFHIVRSVFSIVRKSLTSNLQQIRNTSQDFPGKNE